MLILGPFLLAFFAAPVLCGLYMLSVGIRGRIEWTHPSCAKCRYDLRGLDPAEHKACPECGNDLTKSRGVRFGRTKRSVKLILAGVLLLLSPLFIIGVQQMQQRWNNRTVAVRPSAELIDDLAADATNSMIWNELISRYYAGGLTDQDIAAAIDHVIAHLEAAGGTGNQPLFWSNQFLEAALLEGRVNKDQQARLASAYYLGQPHVSAPARVRAGGEFMFQVVGSHWNLSGFEPIYAVRRVMLGETQLDPKPWGPRQLTGGDTTISGAAQWGLRGNLTVDAEPGEHELVFEIDFGVVEDELGGFGPNLPPGSHDEWPEVLVHELRTVRVPITVLRPDESPITLVSPAEHREMIVRGLRISGVRLSRELDRPLVELVFNPSPRPPVPLSFKVFLRTGELEQEIGTFTAQSGGVGMSGFRTRMSLPDVETVDIVFRPDQAGVESQANWTEIWGEEIVVENVKVIRPSPSQ